MKKTKNFFYFKLISNLRIAIIFFIVFGFNFNFSFGYDPYGIPNSELEIKQNPHTIHSLTDNEKKLRDNLIKAGFITKPRRIDDPSLTRFLYSVSSENKPVNKIFRKECEKYYDIFSMNRNAFLKLINDDQEPNPSWGSLKHDHAYAMRTPLAFCFGKIYDKYASLYKSFTDQINTHYSSNNLSKAIKVFQPSLITQFIDGLNPTKNSTNFKIIKENIDKFKKFQNCLAYDNTPRSNNDSIVDMQAYFQTGKAGHPQSSNDIPFTKKVKSYFASQDNMNCLASREKFTKFSHSDIFKKFIELPKKSCKSIQGLKQSMNTDCQNMINKLEPKYTEDNKNTNNLFYKCNEYVSTAYTECFGEEGKRNDLQEILYLIDQKSPSVCDDNKIDRSQRALESCLTAVKKCTDACHTQIEDFKKDFLQCFFLPDFKLNSYTTLHRHNTCKDRIEKLRNSFINQAKEAPFKVENSRFDTLDSPSKNRSSIAYKIYKACENPLEERQLEKKRNEMRKICREQKQEEKEEQKNQQQNPSIDPLTTSNTNSNNNGGSKGSSSNGGTKSQAFSYGKNRGFKFNNNSQLGNQQNQNSGSPIATVPSDPNSDTKKDDDSSETDISTGEFTGGADSLENTLSSIENDISKNGSQRGLSSSDGSLGGEEELSSEETTSEEEQSEGNPVSSTIRKILSTDKEYGVVNENAYSQQSATQGFFDWMGKKADQAKKVAGNAYDKMVGVGPRAFQEKLHLNNKSVNLFELQGNMLKKACSEHKCPTETSSEPQQISSQ